MAKTISMSIQKPFGPTIGEGKIPEELILKINNFIDNLKGDKNRIDELDAGPKLAGAVTQEVQLPEKILNDGLHDFLGQVTKTFVYASTGKEIKKFTLISSWVVSQFGGEYNPSHWHDGHISGAGYLKLPASFGKNIQEKKAQNFNGYINFIHGSRQFLSKSIQTVKPEIGNIYLFPNYLMHSVNPFYGEGERRSLSFNAYIDAEIFNVYGTGEK